MKSAILCGLIALVGLCSASGGQTGQVGAAAELQLYIKESGTDVVASVQVNGKVTVDQVKEFLTKFNSTKDTKFVIHGWINSDKKPLVNKIVEAYFTENDYNIIFVDWAPEADEFYPRAAEAVPKLGRLLASFVDVLVSNYSTPLSQIHMIGHSLGAHIASVAGLTIQSPGKIARVTGLDPAGIMFRLSTEERLRPEAASFVDVIHTCNNIIGFGDALGHADFYPNGGRAIQPGCGWRDLVGGKCSHSRAYLYFAESITSPKGFLSTECDTYRHYTYSKCDGNNQVYMGDGVSTSAKGTYYLKTNDGYPYGQGNKA